jgi:NO-binding membrane sensor protein with MHYT domain
LDSVDPKIELERLHQELSARQSTPYFARSAIALVLAVIAAGAAGKLFWDGTRLAAFGYAVAAVALGLGYVALHCYRRGAVALKSELERFERMQGLHRALGLDDPSSLLPGR